MRFPVQADGLRFRVATPPREDTEFDTGKVKTRDGLPVHVVDLLVMDGTEADTIRVKVAAASAPAVAPDDLVTVTGLTVLHWAMGDRSGLAFGADAIVRAKETAGGK